MGATLVAGLAPFSRPSNNVTWHKDENAIYFGRHGTVLSSGTLDFTGGGSGGTIELWLRPAKVWTTGSILAFYGSSTNRLFKLQQDYTDLVLRLGDESIGDKGRDLRVKDVFRKKQPFVAVAFDQQATSIYIDGELVERSPQFRLSSRDLSGQLILANAPFRDQSWPGEIKGLGIYETELDAAAVKRHYASWTEHDEPMLENSDHARALYLFRGPNASIVKNVVSQKPDLEIPKRFLVIDQLRFESPLSEYRSERTYKDNAVFNVVGFVPLGLMLSFYFASVRQMKRAALLAVLAGAAVSLVIEYWQSFLPTRYSGCTDLITNTLGTWVGVLLQRLLTFWMRDIKPSAVQSSQ